MATRPLPFTLFGCLALLACGALPRPAHAGYISFRTIDANSATDARIAEGQMFLEVFDRGTVNGVNHVGFRFYNNGPAQSTITSVAFEDGTLLDQVKITYSGSGIGFSEGGTPDFPFLNPSKNYFSDGANSPGPKKGINPGEWVEFEFSLLNNRTYQDTLNAIQLGANGPVPDPYSPNYFQSLRFGIHVTNFASGGSEKLLNNVPPVNPVPAPPGLLLLVSSVPCLLLGWAYRQKLAPRPS